MAASFRTLDELDPKGKRVLVRVDLNVPMEAGVVTDPTRIERVIPTIRDLSEKGARVVLLSHFGRPKGPDTKNSLEPVGKALAKHLGLPVAFAPDCVGKVAAEAVNELKDGDVLLLENTRFRPEEEKNDTGFVGQLAELGDVYVNDAFSAAHRAHASTEGLAHRLPAYAGRSMQAELEALGKALENPARPVVAVVGGAKISSKLDLLENLLEKVDTLIIGGAMANTFLAAQGKAVGTSLCERDLLDTARRIAGAAKAANCEIVLPADGIVAKEFKAASPSRVADVDGVGADEMILDVGPQSIIAVQKIFNGAKTVVWNGPLGAFEVEPFDAGTNAAAKTAAQLTREGRIVSVAGGGDTVAALNHAGVAQDFSYVSTAGGAFLEWLEGKDLPGVAALKA